MHSPRVRTALQSATDPLVVDLGYGALPVTTLELASRLRTVRTDVRVNGLEIDPERVQTARAVKTDTVEFGLGGFELAGLRPVLVRAFNVLRQYPVDAVDEAWSLMRARLAPGGLIVDGTCDELGRRCGWVLLDGQGPVSLTLACDPFAINSPSDLAERLPKILIHQNVSGQSINTLLTAADHAWAGVAGHGVFGARERWRAMLECAARQWDRGRAAAPPDARRRTYGAVGNCGPASALTSSGSGSAVSTSPRASSRSSATRTSSPRIGATGVTSATAT